MTGMSKKSLQILVFGTIILLSIIIFSVLMNNMLGSKENNNYNKYKENENNEIDNSNENNDNKNKPNINKGEYYYEFESVKVKDICPSGVYDCENIIGTLKVEDKTKMLALKYNNSEYSIKIDEKEFYKGNENELSMSEFISYENKYLIIVFSKNNIQSKLILLDKEGNKLLEDKYLKSEVSTNNGIVSYKTLDCSKDNQIYKASIKLIDNKPRIILGESTNEKTNECQ